MAWAERRVRESEERVARQAAIVERLARTGHGWAAETAGIVLTTLETSLDLARRDLRVQCAWTARRQDRLPN